MSCWREFGRNTSMSDGIRQKNQDRERTQKKKYDKIGQSADGRGGDGSDGGKKHIINYSRDVWRAENRRKSIQ